MPTTKKTVPYNRLTVLVPRGKTRQFRLLAKEMGVIVERKNSIERALDDIEAGRVRSWASVEEMFSTLGA